MRRWLIRAVLAVLGLGAAAGFGRAQSLPVATNPPAPGVTATTGPTAVAVPSSVAWPDPAFSHLPVPTPAPALVADPNQMHPFKARLHNLIQRHPSYCWSSHNSVGCGSLEAECTFLFGSCRQFFGEPCFKGQPTIPGLPPPPGAPAYGYGVGAAGGGCRSCPGNF